MKIKVIETKEEYKEALKVVKELVAKDPDPESDEGDRLSLLAKLVQDYESETFPESLPDPVDAILFRMEQLNLKPSDLALYIGSRSKASEVLARKRPLSLTMIRALESGLGIPAKVLIQESSEIRNEQEIAWNRFPVKEMQRRGYFGNKTVSSSNIKELMENFFRPIGSPVQFIGMLRRSYYVRSLRAMDQQALTAWTGCVVNKANKIKFKTSFKTRTVTPDFMVKVSKVSNDPNGPVRVIEFLKDFGIALVIEPHFPRTYLDGVTIMTNKERPVIGLTLRQNRLDNFWFTLMHELAHISLHYNQGTNLFYDDLELSESGNELEDQADQLAGESLIPKSVWENSPAKLIPSPIAAEALARQLGIHVTIVAGKMRHEGHSWQELSDVINKEKVQKYFPEIKWSQSNV